MLLHLSDLHFGTERQTCIRAIQDFCATHQPEVVVVSGDLTQRAKLSEFYHCKQFLESLNTPYLVIPGNHDIPLYHIWKRAFRPFTLYQLFFGSLEKTLITEHFYIVGVNSIRRRYHTRGHISLEQIQKVAKLLELAPKNKLKIIAVHQPFYIAEESKHAKDCPVLAVLAAKKWGAQGAYALLHGHLHNAAVNDLNPILNLNLPNPLYDVIAGTAISERLHGQSANGFNVVHIDGHFEHFLFDENSQSFVSVIK